MMVDQRDEDERFMAQAIAVSLRHLGQTATNPSVGCVIVRKDGVEPVVIASTVTAVGGRPHAETQALAIAGDAARGATVYVTLEPCAHVGKTPPCANALVEAGVARVVVSVIDPDVRVSGHGIEILRAAGIEVVTGILEREGTRALEAYLMRKRRGRPFVTLKLAVSADGMIGIRGQGQVRITGPQSRAEVQRLRAQSDAILVGIGTAIADDPDLTVRIPGEEHRSPIRIVLDRQLQLPLGSRLVRTAGVVPVVVVADPSLDEDEPELEEGLPPSVGPADISPSRGEINSGRIPDAEENETSPPAISPFEAEMSDRTEGGKATIALSTFAARRTALQSAGVEVVECAPGDLDTLLSALATRGISSLFVEGGAKTAQQFLNAGLVDRILLFTGRIALGEEGVASPLDRQLIPVGFTHSKTASFGDDLLDEYDDEGNL